MVHALAATTGSGGSTRRGEQRDSRSPDGSAPFGIAAGPDGALWFTATDRVGRIALDGEIAEFGAPAGLVPGDDHPGPDGALWFTLNQAHAIGRIDVARRPDDP